MYSLEVSLIEKFHILLLLQLAFSFHSEPIVFRAFFMFILQCKPLFGKNQAMFMNSTKTVSSQQCNRCENRVFEIFIFTISTNELKVNGKNRRQYHIGLMHSLCFEQYFCVFDSPIFNLWNNKLGQLGNFWYGFSKSAFCISIP